MCSKKLQFKAHKHKHKHTQTRTLQKLEKAFMYIHIVFALCNKK